MPEKGTDADLRREMIGFAAEWRVHPAQWLPGVRRGNPGRHGGIAHSQTAHGQLFPRSWSMICQGHGHQISGISKSQVSRPCEDIDERVKTFLDRPIEGDWPYLWIDAIYVKVRQNGRIVSVAVTTAVAVNTDGCRGVLGMDMGASEAEAFWLEFLRKLRRRGLPGVKLVISDAHVTPPHGARSQRYGKTAESYLGFIHIVAVRLWMHHFVNRV